VERVKNGLKAARARGKHIGRKKLRNSEMIRALRKKGLTFRAIAELCGCSHGSVHAELVAMKKEEELLKEQMRLAKEEEKKRLAYFKVEIESAEEKPVEELSQQKQIPAAPSQFPPAGGTNSPPENAA
jgi:IS30 family transposase